jgi:cellulose synthase/poly-beta-1,6-N-acetylglucosamine synthase-like glycosyltransferase
MKNYLEISRAFDLENKRERVLYRFFEILPGFLSWSTLFLAVFLSYFSPVLIAIFIILFDIYWLLRVAYFSFHQVASYFEMKKNLRENWLEKAKKIDGFEQIYHLVVLPFYKEGEEIVESSLSALSNCQYPKEKIIIVLATEEKAGNRAKEIAEKMKEKFEKNFFRIFITSHPKNLPNEIQGKGSNVNFAVKEIEKEIESLEIKKENIIFSVFDVDTRPYPHYFGCLTFYYLSLKKEKNVCFQPIPVYHNNVWEAPAFSRVVATSNTFWQMIQQQRPEQLVSYSSHSLPFETLLEVGYPKNVVSDDSRIFWKLYFLKNGNFQTVPLHYPVSMDAVLGKNLISTTINQYRQQRRWAFGVENIPFLLFGFLKNKKISLFKKIQHSFIILEGFWSWAVASLLIFLLGWLPIFLGGERFNFTLLSHNLPILTRNLMAFSMFGMIVCAIISFLLLPPKPKNLSFFKKISIFFQWLLLPLTLIVFGSFPALDAQTRLMFGKYLGFWSTEKYRKEKK